MPGWDKAHSTEEAIALFVENIRKLTPGKYMFVDHPGINSPEMQAITENNIAQSRQRVTDVFTSKAVIQALNEKGVVRISYADL